MPGNAPAASGSVLGDRRRRSGTKQPVHAELDGIDFLTDAHRTMRYAAPRAAEESIVMTEVIVVIFSKNGPVRSKGPFETESYSPARPGDRRIGWCAKKVDVKFIARPSAAPLAV